MIDESKAADIEGYLSCFSGDLRERLEANLRQMGEEGFRAYLRDRLAELKGVAIYDVEESDAEASLTVEYVFAEESERQSMRLERTRGTWRIAGADASRRERSLIPYGTPIEQAE